MANEVMVKQKNEISSIINAMIPQWSKVLPSVLTPARMARVALSCINKTPQLQECFRTEKGKTSIMSALMTCAELGLEPDGRVAYILPFNDRKNNCMSAQVIIGYQGIKELVMRTGQVSTIHAEKVCENDKFEYNLGIIKNHEIDFKKPRGNAYAYFCHVVMKDGTVKDEVMSIEDINAIKVRSKASGFGPWVTDYDQMALKTVFRRCSKWLPMSSDIREKIEKDDDQFDFESVKHTDKFASAIVNNSNNINEDYNNESSDKNVIDTEVVVNNNNNNSENKTNEQKEEDNLFGGE